MACKGCKKEGETQEPQIVVGWKAYMVTGQVYAGRTLADWRDLPDDGVLVVMLYYDKFCTQGQTRYRRILQGNDWYFIAPGVLDQVYGHGNESPDEIARRYPGAVVKRGQWTDDTHYQQVVAIALDDHAVSEIGIAPVDGTDDR